MCLFLAEKRIKHLARLGEGVGVKPIWVTATKLYSSQFQILLNYFQIVYKIIPDCFLRTNSTSAAWAGGGGEGGQEEGVGGGQGWQGQFELAIYSHNLS